MRRALIVMAVASLALLAVSTSALAGGGNSANAKLCQKGAWMNLVRADGTTFVDQAACVSYGASGGTPVPPAQFQGQALCVSYGGTFRAFAVGEAGHIFWTCASWTYSSDAESVARQVALSDACIADTGPVFFGFGTIFVSGVWTSICSRT